jgi:hypothetical protein
VAGCGGRWPWPIFLVLLIIFVFLLLLVFAVFFVTVVMSYDLRLICIFIVFILVG